jgi:predicted O-methyltransferase YrrM
MINWIRQITRKFLLKAFTKLFPDSFLLDSRHYQYWEKQGYHITRVFFYSPLPDTRDITPATYDKRWSLKGIAMNDNAQVSLLKTFHKNLFNDYSRLPAEPTNSPQQYYLTNGLFASVDGEILYCMVKHFFPKKIFEIGSGNTTYLIAQALNELKKERRHKATLTTFDPFPNVYVKKGFAGLTNLEQTRVQDVGLERFAELKANDILFIDSSHVVAVGSDVQYLLMEVLSHLNTGVIVHFHDIFLPEEYPKQWLLKDFRFWNEQYMLQAFLQHNNAFNVLWAGNYMKLRHSDLLKRFIPSFNEETIIPGSFWIRKVR